MPMIFRLLFHSRMTDRWLQKRPAPLRMTDIYVFRLQKQFHVLSCLPDMIVSFPESRSFVHRSSDKILHRPVTASRIYCILPYFFSL